MTRLLLALLAGTAAGPALAQHGGHAQPAPPPRQTPVAACTPEHAAMGHCTMPAPTPAPAPPPASASTCTPEHAAMGHCRMPAPSAPPVPSPAPSATCTAEHAAMGHCAMPTASPAPAATCTPEHAAMGHCVMPQAATPVVPSAACTAEHAAMGHCTMPGTGAGGHAGHGAQGTAHQAPPVAPPPAAALTGPAHAQDIVFDPALAARSRARLVREHGGMTASKLLIDHLEATFGDEGQGYAWDAQFWHGGDIDKLWLKSEGEGLFGDALEVAEFQALWSHAIDPWFDLQVGLRQDVGPGPDPTRLVLGIQGLAPYWFEVDGAVFLSADGDVTARVEAEYDLRLTSVLVLQPKVELDLSLQDVPELGLGSGLTTAELGLRLRHELFPRRGPAVVAPYVGLSYERAFGRTADFRRADGDEAEALKLLIGVRTWF